MNKLVVEEQQREGDMVVLEKHTDAFETIWLKTFVILKSGALIFSGMGGSGGDREDAKSL